MSAAAAPATVSTSCTPTYIVLRRGEDSTYTTYTFASAKEVSKWAIDEMTSELNRTVSPSSDGSSLFNFMTKLLLPAPTVSDFSKYVAGSLNSSEKNALIKAEAKQFLSLEFLQNADLLSESDLPDLTETQSKLLASFVVKDPFLYAEKLFVFSDKVKKNTLFTNPFFVQECQKNLTFLTERLLKGNINNSVIRVFKGLEPFLREGIHHNYWNSHWENVKLNGVGVWGKDTVDAILQECMRSWLRDEKPSESVREFFLKVFIVQNFVSEPSTYIYSLDREVGSSDFLLYYTNTLTNTWTGGLPAEFASWISSGVTFAHCKAALTSLGFKQIRRSSGQYYQGLRYKPYNYDPLAKDHMITHTSFQETHDGSVPFDKADISMIGGDICEYEEGPTEKEGDNVLFTKNFHEMIHGLKPDESPQMLYCRLRDEFAADCLEECADKKKSFKDARPSPLNKIPTMMENKKESFGDVMLRVTNINTETEKRRDDYYPYTEINKAKAKAKESATPPVQIVWTPDAETRITHVT